jgi:hypothetical protein
MVVVVIVITVVTKIVSCLKTLEREINERGGEAGPGGLFRKKRGQKSLPISLPETLPIAPQ